MKEQETLKEGSCFHFRAAPYPLTKGVDADRAKERSLADVSAEVTRRAMILAFVFSTILVFLDTDVYIESLHAGFWRSQHFMPDIRSI